MAITTNIRVLQIGKFYPIRGGVEKVMYDLTEGLGARGVYCTMLCAASKGQNPCTLELNPHARLIVLPAIAKVAATMLCPKMVSYLRQHRSEYDIVHIHHPDPMAAVALFFSGYKGKVVLHYHSDILKQKVILFFYKPLLHWLIKRANVIVGTTPVYIKESPFLKNCQRKCTYLPIGVDELHPIKEEVEAIRNRYKGKTIVYSLGRLVEYKGFEFLVKAMSYLPHKYQLVIGGQGPLKEELIKLARELGVQNRVDFVGWIPEEHRDDWFGACDVFALSSIHKTEAFAIVQVEAMCVGKPLVSTRIPGSGVSWVNADTESGIVVEPRDPRAMAEAILNICKNKVSYNSYCSNSRKRFESLFQKSQMIDGCLKIYSEL